MADASPLELTIGDPPDPPGAGRLGLYPHTDGSWHQIDSSGTDATISGTPGASGAGYGGTSTTSLAIATGSKTFTTQAGLAYLAGSRVRAASAADGSNFMEGLVSSYSSTTLDLVVDTTGGSGTHADWNLSIAGEAPSVWRGAWSAGSYDAGDAVSHNGSSYVANVTTTDEPPSADWDVLAAKGADGTDGAAVEVLDEGSSLTAAVTSLDFVGAGVTATATGDAVTVTIPGGGGTAPSAAAATATVATDETRTTNAAYGDLTTPGPAVTVTVNTKAMVIVTARIYGAGTAYPRMSFAVSGANTIAASDAHCVGVGESNPDHRVSATTILTGLTPGSTTFTAKYHNIGSGTTHFLDRDIAVIPLD